jgi:zinc transport system ATP-binding protein
MEQKTNSLEIARLENVYLYFNQSAVLEDVNLSVKEDSFLAIIGPNGGGKTTLLKVILGLVKPDKGSVTVFGKKPMEGKKEIGYLPQYRPINLNFPISVYDVVLEGRYAGAFKPYKKEDYLAVDEALEIVEMLSYKNRQIGRLSGGQMQRIFLARAIARKPKLLLLDEPTASMDPDTQTKFYKMLLRLKEKMAVLFVTHDVGAVSTYFEQIACLNRRLFYHGPGDEAWGKLEESYGCPVDLIQHAAHHKILDDHRDHEHSGGEEK